MSRHLFTERVKLAAAGYWADILQGICGLTDAEVNPRKRNIPCPHCGGRDRYEFKSPEDGRYFCRQCGPGDGFSLVMKMDDCRFPEAVERVGRYLGIENPIYQDKAEEEAERARIAAKTEARRKQREAQQAREAAEKQRHQQRIASQVPSILAQSQPADPNHPYLLKKQLPAFDLRQNGRLLLVGLYGEGHRLVNIEHITPTGKKFGLTHGQREAVYHRFGSECWTVYVCEGWATGASLWLMEKQAVRVYAAMGKGNLESVARIAQAQNPESRLIIAADNDSHQPDNPGLSEALTVAHRLSIPVLMPALANHSRTGADFSDVYLFNQAEA